MNLYQKFTSYAVAGLTTMALTYGSAATAQAQSATVSLTDGNTGRTYNQTVQCRDYMILNGNAHMTNKVAGQIDIGSDISLNSWEPSDMKTMADIKSLSPNEIYPEAQKILNQGYSEIEVIPWAQSQAAHIIKQRTINHFVGTHRIPESQATAALNSARDQCERALGLE